MIGSNFWKTNAPHFQLWLSQTRRLSRDLLINRAPSPSLTGQGWRSASSTHRTDRKIPKAATKEHDVNYQRWPHRQTMTKKDTTIRERPKVIRFFIPPFSQTWVHFFSSKIKWCIRLCNLPLLFTISRGHLAVYYEDFYRSFNLPILYEILNITDQNYYVTIPVAAPSPGVPHQCSRKSPPRNTSSVRCSLSPPKSFRVIKFRGKIQEIPSWKLSMYVSIFKALRSPTQILFLLTSPPPFLFSFCPQKSFLP